MDRTPSETPQPSLRARFGRFELVHSCRELRLDGEPQPMQPLIFSLLCYLVRNRDRVVGKDELLDKLWPETFVTESSLQKAMSLARGVLREGQAEDAIRTLPRHGYRFVAEVEVSEDTPSPKSRVNDEEDELARAVQANAAAGDVRAAVKAALRLARLALDRIEPTTARGWVLRVERILGPEERTREWGLVHATHSRIALYSGDNEECQRRAELAMEIGRELGDPELEVMGLADLGHAKLSCGEVQQSVGCHEEAAAIALSGVLDPEITGLIYCSVIWASSNRGDWTRANEWTKRYGRWLEQHPTRYYPGLCMLHRAELHQARGELEEARAEIAHATSILDEAAPWAAGEAHRVQGQVLLDLGDLEGAEAEFRRSLEFGWEPQPGFAWLLFAQGQREKAMRSLRRAIDSPFWSTAERRMFLRAEEVSLALACGAEEVARESIDALRAGSRAEDSAALCAEIARAEGEMALHEGRLEAAVDRLRAARDGWLSVGCPPSAARVRLVLAEALDAAGQADMASLEREALRGAFLPMAFLRDGTG